MKIVLPLLCRSKKNSQQIVYKNGRSFIVQSKLYKQFERDCGYFLKKYARSITTPVTLKCTFYVPDKRKRDIVNLLNAIQDILVHYHVLADDNYNIVQSLDGTRIIHRPKQEPETIIEITEYKGE